MRLPTFGASLGPGRRWVGRGANPFRLGGPSISAEAAEPPSRSLAIIVAILALAAVVDYLAPTPYVMTPLYAVPILIAAWRLPPRAVLAVAILANVVGIASALIQGTPREIWALYGLGLVLIGGLAVLVAEQRLRLVRHGEAIAAANRQLSEYERVIAHDIRQPLTVARAHAALLRREIEHGDLARLGYSAESIEVASRRLESLVCDLVRHAQAEATRARLALQSVDLATYVPELIGRRTRGGATRVRFEAIGPARVLADPDELARILDNLLSNGEKYSEPGTPIGVRVDSDEAVATVSVTNRGRGIAPEDLPRVFEQGFRTKDAPEHAEGWGVGLYIARGLVEAHGGRIWVESEPSRETTFSFTVPLAPS